MKYNLRNAIFDESGAKQLENVGTQSEPQNPETSEDMHTGLTQELQNVCVKEFFHVAAGTILFLPDTSDKLYRVQVLENCDQYTKVRYFGWGQSTTLGSKQNQFGRTQNTKSSCAAVGKLTQTSQIK